MQQYAWLTDKVSLRIKHFSFYKSWRIISKKKRSISWISGDILDKLISLLGGTPKKGNLLRKSLFKNIILQIRNSKVANFLFPDGWIFLFAAQKCAGVFICLNEESEFPWNFHPLFFLFFFNRVRVNWIPTFVNVTFPSFTKASIFFMFFIFPFTFLSEGILKSIKNFILQKRVLREKTFSNEVIIINVVRMRRWCSWNVGSLASAHFFLLFFFLLLYEFKENFSLDKKSFFVNGKYKCS